MYNGKSGGKMRGLYSSKTEIRHKIFTEIARMAYEEQSPEEVLEELPYRAFMRRPWRITPCAGVHAGAFLVVKHNSTDSK